MDAETAAPSAAARHLQMDYSPVAVRPQVIKFCYRKRATGHSRNGKDDSSQDPKIQTPSSPLSRQSLSTPAITTYHAGGFYEINHEMLPPRTPIHLKSIRVVKVTDYTSLDITVSFPSLLALRNFFSSFPAPSAGPELDECFFMSSTHAARILRRRVSEQELEGEMHQDSFWLVNPCLYDFSASSHPATLPDALSSPEAPPAQPKAPAPSCRLLDTLKCDGTGWGLRRRIRYIGRPRDASKEASIGGYETEASVKEQQRPAQQEDKRSSVSGKRMRDEAGKSNDKPSNEKRTKRKTYKSPKKLHVESKDGDPRRGKDRWLAERYAAAERSLLEIMRSSGARLGAPVMRQALRDQARKRIGDTGLLDHLLKHMAGRVPDGSTERFRRRHNADGAMEYWLEPADMAEVRRQAGVSDPYWVPPPGWKPGDNVSPAAGDLLVKRQVEELAEELNDVKRHMEQLSSNMVELGKEANSEAEKAYSSWKWKHVMKFCYRKRPTGHSRNGKDDSNQDPKIHPPSPPLSRQSLSTPAITTYHAGGFYEINHEMLPPRTPIHLKSIRVVKVTDYTSLDITVSFPSLLALRSFFSSFPVPSGGPELDECFFMSSTHAARILRRLVSEQELEGEIHQDSFWLVNPCLYDFSASSHPATIPNALSSPEAPPAQPKTPAPSCRLLELETMKCDGAGWGVRHRTSVKEQRSPAQQEDKRSSVSSKRNRIARPLFFILIILALLSTGECLSKCTSSDLANNINHFCNSTSRTMDCCEPIVFSVDVGGGIDCLCLVSKDPSMIERGYSFRDLMGLYVDCGGLHPEAIHHTRLGFCEGTSSPPPPPHYYSPPPPTSSAAKTKPVSAISWEGWNGDVLTPMHIIEGLTGLLLACLAARFRAYLKCQLRRLFRWMGFGHSASERMVDAVFTGEEAR